jgi:hypothetical protein
VQAVADAPGAQAWLLFGADVAVSVMYIAATYIMIPYTAGGVNDPSDKISHVDTVNDAEPRRSTALGTLGYSYRAQSHHVTRPACFSFRVWPSYI